MAVSKYKCKFCGEYFPAETVIKLPAGRFCTYQHASEFGRQEVEKKKAKAAAKAKKIERANTRAQKEKLKTRSDWMKEAQREFNRYIRLRDHGQPCISCGLNTGAKMNAGHYRSVGACPELRFNELNCHIQCEKCNSWLSGNIIEYRKNLLIKIGDKAVEWLEGKHEPLKLTIDDIKELKNKYRKIGNEIERSLSNG